MCINEYPVLRMRYDAGFLVLKYSKSVQVFINGGEILRYAHVLSYFKAICDSKWETKPDSWAVSGHVPDDMRVQHLAKKYPSMVL